MIALRDGSIRPFNGDVSGGYCTNVRSENLVATRGGR
jgi:hypothetical protein